MQKEKKHRKKQRYFQLKVGGEVLGHTTITIRQCQPWNTHVNMAKKWLIS